MRYIAHRGNINGQNPDLENSPKYILKAIESGYDVEIDVWKTNDLYLGHDKPEYKIELSFLLKNQDRLWCHAKNKEALEYLIKNGLHVFWHQKDSYTLTSKGYIWAFPGLMINGVLVMPENKLSTDYILENIDKIKGICSDEIKHYKDFLQFTF